MAYALVVSTSQVSPDTNSVTTASINTTGASILVAGIVDYQAVSVGTMSDSKSNTWNRLTETYIVGRVVIYYSINPTVGSGHTFTYTNTGAYPAIAVGAFSGAKLTSPFDQEGNISDGSGSGSVQYGTITPTESNELWVAILGLDASSSTPTIDSSFTRAEFKNYSGGVNFGIALGYFIQGAASALAPTWSYSAVNAEAVIATFKVATATAIKTRKLLLGVGL